MFAFAVWDRQTHTLTLARDRVGEKPLYYGWQGNVFLFGSQLKALRAHPAFTGQIDRGALSLLLRHNAIPAPYSIYQGIAKLPPGCLLTVSLQQRDPQVSPYWSAAQVAEGAVANPFTGSADEATDELEALLKDAVDRQMMSDVPLGAFLSGGVDSSTVVALMQAQSTRPVKTFSIGFHEPGYNEAEYAGAVARHLGTDHTELYVTPADAMAVIPRLPDLYDEPFADSSQIPTFLVSQLARQDVTVSLSGDAGDELFCGYNRYQWTASLWGTLSKVPALLREWVAAGVTSVESVGHVVQGAGAAARVGGRGGDQCVAAGVEPRRGCGGEVAPTLVADDECRRQAPQGGGCLGQRVGGRAASWLGVALAGSSFGDRWRCGALNVAHWPFARFTGAGRRAAHDGARPHHLLAG